jgi:hypothetical protein
VAAIQLNAIGAARLDNRLISKCGSKRSKSPSAPGKPQSSWSRDRPGAVRIRSEAWRLSGSAASRAQRQQTDQDAVVGGAENVPP